MSEEAKEALENLTNFVKRNIALKHLDLSNTEMQHSMLTELINAVNEA